MATHYIGLANTLHDSAICFVSDKGEVLFSEATERYLQNKRSINCAPDFFQRTLELIEEYSKPRDEFVVAQSWSEQTANLMASSLNQLKENERKLHSILGEFPDYVKTHFSSREFLFESQLACLNQTGNTLKYELNQREGARYLATLPKRMFDHHLTHAATGCYTSPFREAVCAVLDGMGESSSTCCYAYNNGEIKKIETVSNSSPGSLGFFYTLLCVVCGFGHLTGEEWKVMGLAAYGEFRPEIYELLRSMISIDGLSIQFASDSVLLGISRKLHHLRRKKGTSPFDAANLAYAGQQVFSEIYFQFLNNLYDLGISENLVIGGGCALNSSANGQILQRTRFKKLHVYSAPGDDGNALGAALLAFRQDHPDCRPAPRLSSPYLGSEVSKETLARVVKFGPPRQERLDLDSLCLLTARKLMEGKIVGWVQGRAEFGPRALGNRSILADPRSPHMKDQINSRVKFREAFRPFAPAILHEYGPEYFVNYQETPYMERALRFREEVIARVPAVVHEDRSGRLQTVKREWNERFYLLISKFHELTGIPLLLNTSFNVMGKPIMHSVEDAIAVFYTSGLDVLVIEDYFFEK